MLPFNNFIVGTLARCRGNVDIKLFTNLKWLGIATALLIPGCATITASTQDNTAIAVPTQWHAPLPHDGKLTDLNQWWSQFNDPLMLRLIEAGQQVSPTLAQASARIADARATSVTQRAALLPSLSANVSSSRGISDLGMPISKVSSSGLQASWELDIFGANHAAVNAAQARLESSQAGWHNARVSVAAEIATTYIHLRACQAQVTQSEIDANSREQTSQITRIAANAGFQSPAAADLANASAAQGQVTLVQQRTQCDLLIKALIALTAQDEITLRQELSMGTGLLPPPTELNVNTMPAQVLAQRPDIYAAERDVIAASADFTQAQAQRWPRIALSGNIGTNRVDSGGISTNGTVWSIGPVSITLPIFDGGSRRANAEAARVRYETATTVYAARLREAIRDVEVAFVTLDSTTKRSKDAFIATNGYERSYAATAASYQAGMVSLFELEDARRSMVAAQSNVIELNRERVTAWISLYRALGGGWSSSIIKKSHR